MYWGDFMGKQEEDLNNINVLVEEIMNNADKITISVAIISLPFLLSFFWKNYTGTAIGLTILGSAITIKLYDLKIRSKAIWCMWIAIIVINCVLLGIEYILPKISFN